MGVHNAAPFLRFTAAAKQFFLNPTIEFIGPVLKFATGRWEDRSSSEVVTFS
jgi:hypothetical protein